MNIEIILIVLGEPFSTFSEILGKYFSSKNILKIILIGNVRLFKDQMKTLKYKFPLNEIDNYENAELNKINIINVDFKYKKVFSKISSKSKTYIENCFTLIIYIKKKLK